VKLCGAFYIRARTIGGIGRFGHTRRCDQKYVICVRMALSPRHHSPTDCLALVPHPATPCAPVQAIEVALQWQGAAELRLRYRIRARMAALRVPEPEPPGPAEGLWRRLCLEAFAGAGEGEGRYHEFNFSPSGRWAAFAFSAPRVRDAAGPALAIEPRLRITQTDAALTLTAALPLAALPPLERATAWQVGLSAVIETMDGALSYWALAHPAPRPDFHHRAGWTLSLTPSTAP
jgi:hypothetical protein